MPGGRELIPIGSVGPWILGLFSGAAGMIAVALARWNIGALRREQMVKTIAEYKAVLEQQDREMARLRERVKLDEARGADLTERLRGQIEQCDYLLRRQYRWDRYVARLHRQMRDSGMDVPPLPPEDQES